MCGVIQAAKGHRTTRVRMSFFSFYTLGCTRVAMLHLWCAKLNTVHTIVHALVTIRED